MTKPQTSKIDAWRIAGIPVLLMMLFMSGCASEFELSEPPDVQALIDSYNSPKATVDQQTVEEFLELYSEQRRQLKELGDFDVLIDPLREFAEATRRKPDGTIVIDDAPLRADAQINLKGRCRGWNGQDAKGTFAIELAVRNSMLVPVGWGTVENCGDTTVIEEQDLQYRFAGDVLVYIPTLLNEADQPLEMLLEVNAHLVEVNSASRTPWSGSLRLIDDVLELLVNDSTGKGLVFFSVSKPDTIGIRGANGIWTCDEEQQQCEPEDSQDDGFHY